MLTHTSSNIPISSPTNKPDKRENYDKSESCGYLGHRKNFKQPKGWKFQYRLYLEGSQTAPGNQFERVASDTQCWRMTREVCKQNQPQETSPKYIQKSNPAFIRTACTAHASHTYCYVANLLRQREIDRNSFCATGTLGFLFSRNVVQWRVICNAWQQKLPSRPTLASCLTGVVLLRV